VRLVLDSIQLTPVLVRLSSQARENWFHRLFASVLGFIGFLVLRPSILARYRRLVTHIQQHLLASSLSVSLTFTVVGLNWVLHRYVRSRRGGGIVLPTAVSPLTCVLAVCVGSLYVMQTALGGRIRHRGVQPNLCTARAAAVEVGCRKE
jgi:uncharacterized membrane protein